MTEPFDDPFGQGRMRQRLSVQETTRRMLDAGVAMVNDTGLRVSFDLLSFEDVIAQADVARSAVYKRWPRKEMYYSELLLDLAGKEHPAVAAFDMGTIRVALQVARDHDDWLESPDGRRRLAVEMCRLGALQNFEALRQRDEWQPYMALHSTLLALPQNNFRQALQLALERSETNFFHQMGMFYEQMLAVIGYRTRPGMGDASHSEMASIGGAAVIGMVLTSGAVDRLGEQRFYCDPFGVGEHQDWSYPALGFASIVMNFVEPDPEVTWDKARVKASRSAVAALVEQMEQVTTGEVGMDRS